MTDSPISDDEVRRRLDKLRDEPEREPVRDGEVSLPDPPSTQPDEAWVGPSLDRINGDLDRPPLRPRRSSTVQIEVHLPPGREDKLEQMQRELGDADLDARLSALRQDEDWLGPPPPAFQMPDETSRQI